MLVNIFPDSHNQFFHVTKDSASEPILRKITEKAFDHVQPRTAGGREMNVIAGPRRQPLLHGRVFMGSVVVEHEMNLQTEEYGNMLGTRLG